MDGVIDDERSRGVEDVSVVVDVLKGGEVVREVVKEDGR
jgi:hypothetical protein